jgi:WD40 repeat protein
MGRLLGSLDQGKSPVRHLATVGPNSLLAASDDGVIRLWNIEEERIIRTFEGHHSPITSLSLLHDEFASGDENGSILRWKLNTERSISSFNGHQSRINGIRYLDSLTLVSIGGDRTLRIWNVPSGRQLRSVIVSVFAADALEVTASNEVALGTFAGEIQIWKPRSQETRPRRSFKYRSVGVGAICVLTNDLGVSPQGYLFGIQTWNPRTGALGAEIHVPGGGVTALARFGSSHLLCGSKDGTLSAWSIEALRAQESNVTTGSIYAVAAFDATTAVSTSPDGPVYVWNAQEGLLLRTLVGHSDSVSSVCVLDSNRIVSSSSGEGTLRVWNPRTGDLLNTILCPKAGALAQFTGDLFCVVQLDISDQQIQIWDATHGQKIVDIPAFAGGVSTLCKISGRFLLMATYEGTVWHLDISTMADRQNFPLRGHESGVFSLALIDPNHLASGSSDKTIRIWNLRTQETIQVLRGHESAVTGLSSISSRLLASASADHTIKVWDLETGSAILKLRLDSDLSSLTAMPDGRTLVAGDVAGKVHFLRLEGTAS